MHRFVFLLLILSSHLVEAANQSCEDADLNTANPSLLKVPDTQSTALCYAIVGARMMDYYRLKQDPNVTSFTHPVYGALVSEMSAMKDPEKVKEGYSLVEGSVTFFFQQVKSKGVCSYDEIETRLKDLRSQSGMTSEELAVFLNDVLFKYRDATTVTSTISDDMAGRYSDNHRCAYTGFMYYLIKTKMIKLAPTALLQSLFEGCKKSSVADVPTPTFYPNETPAKQKAHLDQAMDAGLPAGIHICNQSLITSGYVPKVVSPDGKTDCNKHLVLVSGRKSIDGQCSYLIQNPGENFPFLNVSKACACIDNQGNYKQVCSAEEVKRYVGCWYPADYVTQKLNATYTFPNSKPLPKAVGL